MHARHVSRPTLFKGGIANLKGNISLLRDAEHEREKDPDQFIQLIKPVYDMLMSVVEDDAYRENELGYCMDKIDDGAKDCLVAVLLAVTPNSRILHFKPYTGYPYKPLA